MLGIIAISIHLCTLRSFGVPYLAPMAPLKGSELKGVLWRSPMWMMDTRPHLTGESNVYRQSQGKAPSPKKGGKGKEDGQFFTKRILLLLATLVSVPLLSGCWDRLEVNDLAIVTAAVIDKKDDNQIELSNQIFIPKTLSSGDGEAGRSRGGKMIVIASQTGKNIAEALSKLQGKMPRKIFGEQYSVFIFSEKIAKQGMESKSIWIFYSGIQSQEGEPICQ